MFYSILSIQADLLANRAMIKWAVNIFRK